MQHHVVATLIVSYLLIGCNSNFSQELPATATQQLPPAARILPQVEVQSVSGVGSATMDRDGLPVTANISVKLSAEPVPESVNEQTLFVTLDPAASGLRLADFDPQVCVVDRRLDVSISIVGNEVILDPDLNLECGSVHYVCLTKEIRFQGGGVFNGSTFAFTTAACPTSSVSINDGAQRVNQKNVTVTVASADAQEYALTNAKDCSGELTWQPYNANNNRIAWQLAGVNESTATPSFETTVYAKFRRADQLETPCIADSIIFDNVAPQGTTVTWSNIGFGTNNQGTLTLAGDDASQIAIFENNSCGGSANWQAFATQTSYTFSTNTPGQYPLSVQFKDAAGNSACTATTVTLSNPVTDTTAPTLSNLSIATSTPSASLTPTINFSLDESANVSLYSDAACSTAIAADTNKTAGNQSLQTNSLSADTSTDIYMKATDAAGNSTNCISVGSYSNDMPPTTGTDPSITATSATSISLTWGAASDAITSAPNLQYKVVRAASATDLSDVATAEAATLVMDWTANTTSTTASGLSHSTTYVFAVLVKDAADNKVRYNLVTDTTTGPDTSAPVLSNVSVATANPSASLTPTINFSLDESADVSLYSDAACTTAIAADTNKTAGNQSLQTNSLSADASTDIYIKATDAAGNTTNCILVGSYNNDMPPTAGTDPSITGTNETTISLTWGVASDTITSNAADLHYKVMRAASATDLSDVTAAEAATLVMDWTANTTSTTASLLNPGSTYVFAVLVKDAADNKIRYNLVSGTTNSFFSNLSLASTYSNTDLTTTAQFTIGQDATITLYSDNTCSNAVSVPTAKTAGSPQTLQTSTLSANTTTAIYIQAITLNADVSACTSIDSFTHDDTSPSVNNPVTITAKGPTTMTLTWLAASDNMTSAGNLQYKVVSAASTAAIDSIAEAEEAAVVMDWTNNTTTTNATGLTPATTYAFAVLVKDTAGNIGLYNPVSDTTAAIDTTAPVISSPTLTATPAAGSITLSWTAASDGTSGTPQAMLEYAVYQSTNTTNLTLTSIDASLTNDDGVVWLENDFTQGLTYEVKGLNPSTTYYFNVVVRDLSGNRKEYTAVSATTSGDSQAPVISNPTITAQTGITVAELSWAEASDNGTERNDLQYQVVQASNIQYVSGTPSNIDTAISNSNASIVSDYSAGSTSTIVTGLTANTTYHYVIIVRDLGNNRATYTPVSITTLSTDSTPPSTNSLTITGTPRTSEIDLDWPAASDDATPSSMLVYRVIRGGNISDLADLTTAQSYLASNPDDYLTDWTVGMTSITLEDLVSGSTYTLSVLAKDASGKISIYDPVDITTVSDNNPPSNVASLSGTGAVRSVDLIWNAANDDHTPSNKLQYKLIQGSSTTDLSTVADAESDQIATNYVIIDWTENLTSATAAELNPNTNYHFVVLVKDKAGNKQIYTPVTVATTNPSDTVAPTIATSNSMNLLTTVAALDNSGIPQVTVSWNKASDNTTSAASLKYQLVMNTAEDRVDSISKALSATVISPWFSSNASVISATARNLSAGTTYAFNVVVKDIAGNMNLYVPTTETTDQTGSGIQTLNFPSAENNTNFNINSLYGERAGFFWGGYYYQDMTGRKKSQGQGNANYSHYLGKFSLTGSLQTSFGSSGWLNLSSINSVPNLTTNRSPIHWLVCNNNVLALVNTSSTSYKLYTATITSTSLSFSNVIDTLAIASNKVFDFSCLGTKAYITGIKNGTTSPIVYAYDGSTFSNGSDAALSSGTALRTPFLDGTSLYFTDWTGSNGYFRNLNTNLLSITGSTLMNALHFPTTTFTGGNITNGIFGGWVSGTNVSVYTGVGHTMKIWTDTPSNIRDNLTGASAFDPSVSFRSAILRQLKQGAMMDGRVCTAANKYLGFDHYKYYSSTHARSGEFGGYAFFLVNADGSRSYIYNKGKEITMRNKHYATTAHQSYVSIACDEATDTVVLGYKISRGHTKLHFMRLDPYAP